MRIATLNPVGCFPVGRGFTRGSTTGQFVDAAAVSGWHLKPGHDCVLFGTGSSVGCAGQDIFVFTHP